MHNAISLDGATILRSSLEYLVVYKEGRRIASLEQINENWKVLHPKNLAIAEQLETAANQYFNASRVLIY